MKCDPGLAIELDKVFAAKGIRLPRLAVRWLEKFFHLDEINEFLVRGYEGVEFCRQGLSYLDVSLQVEGLENVPSDGRFTFVSNHPLGGIDGVALGALIGERFDGRIRYLVNDFLMNVKGIAPICVGINMVGSQNRNLPELVDGAFNSDNQMILFPAGLCSRLIDGEVRDLPWSKAFITKSVAAGRDVVPIHFIAENSRRFYRIANLCRKLGLKVNLAMACLPDEMFRARHGTFKVVIGKPIPYGTFDNSRTPVQWAQWVRGKVYSL